MPDTYIGQMRWYTSSAYIEGLSDSDIISEVDDALSVDKHEELEGLLTDVADDGVNSAEYDDLVTIARELNDYEYLSPENTIIHIFLALVNGNAANSYWTGVLHRVRALAISQAVQHMQR